MRSRKALVEEFECDLKEDSSDIILVKQNQLIFEVLLDIRDLSYIKKRSEDLNKKGTWSNE